MKMEFPTQVFLLFTLIGHVYTATPTQNDDVLEKTRSMDTQYAILDCFGAQVYNNLGGSLTDCLMNLLLFKLSHGKEGKVSFLGGLVELERSNMDSPVSQDRMARGVQGLNGTMGSLGEKLEALDTLSQQFAVKLHVLDGYKLRVSRRLDVVSVGVEEEEEEEEDDDKDGRAGLSSGNKKKKKPGVHKKYKQFLSILPMFLIPVFIQATLLPLFLATLKLIAIKSVFIGKLALLLVGYNALRNASIRRKQDDVDEHIAVEHYGYNGDMEYGAMLNSRAL